MIYLPFRLVSCWFFVAFVDVRIVLLDHAFINDEGLGCVDDRSEDGDRDLNHNDLHNVDLVADGLARVDWISRTEELAANRHWTEEVGNVVVFAVQGLDGLLVLRSDVVALRSR